MLMKYILERKPKFLLCCSVIILFYLPLYAQLTQRVITVTRSSMDIPGLAKTIAAQTGVAYSLNMQNTSLKKYVHLKPGKWKLEDVMKEVQAQVGLNYKILGDHILFTDYKPVKKIDSVPVNKPENIQVAKPANKAGHTSAKPFTKVVKPSSPKERPATAVNISESLPIASSPVLILTSLHTDYKVTPPAMHVKPVQVASREQNPLNANRISKKESRHFELPGWTSPLAAIGVTANDIVYLSATAKAGIQYVYGIGSLGFSSRGMRIRYGAGIRVPLDEENALHAEFTTGTFSRNYSDTIKPATKILERLNSYGVSWSTTMSGRLQLQLELNYSTLKKSGDSSLSSVPAESNYFGYGKALYRTKISAVTNNGQQTSWIGARISLFYNLRRK